MFPHEKRESREYGRSPGNGITPIPLSRDPLATEGEATPGPDDETPWDDYNPYEDNMEFRDPSRDPDPFVFDDVDDVVGEVSPPALDPGRRGPTLPF